jgi:hypothetical protein
MKPFIPPAEGEEPSAQIQADIRQLLRKELNAELDERQVQSLRYDQNRSAYQAAVGRKHALNGEPVLAIFYERGRDLYHVCTPSRGAVGGTPILVGGWSVAEVTWATGATGAIGSQPALPPRR